VNFLRPAFFAMPVRLIALIALIFLLVFRGFIFQGVGIARGNSWMLRLGFEHAVADVGILSHIAFSFQSFAIFLFKIWSLSLIYVRTGRGISSSHTTETLRHLSRPFTDFRTEVRPFILLVYGMLLVLLLNLTGRVVPGLIEWQSGGHRSVFLEYGISVLAGWLDILPIMRSLMMFLIIGSLVSMFTGSHGLMFFCREWMDFFLGPLRRYPIRVGVFDLTPIIFFIAVQFIYGFLKGILIRSYLALG